MLDKKKKKEEEEEKKRKLDCESDCCWNNNNNKASRRNTWITKTHPGKRQREACEGRTVFFFFFLSAQFISCFGKYATSVRTARLTALVARMVHACTRR